MENKSIVIAVCVLCLLMTLLFACSKGCKSNDEPKIIYQRPKVQQNNADKDKEESNTRYSTFSGGRSSGGYSYKTESVSPPALLSAKDKERMRKKREESRKKLRENADLWLQHKTNDPRLSAQSLEIYKIKSHQAFTNGSVALRNKDYKAAVKFFNETVKDPNATAVTKYFALENMMIIAQKTKDIKLYFIAARISAMLCATEDLTVLGITKDTHQLDWVEKVENTIYARNDKNYFEKCVQLKMDFYGAGVTREDAEEDVRNDIEFYTNLGLFKEMLE